MIFPRIYDRINMLCSAERGRKYRNLNIREKWYVIQTRAGIEDSVKGSCVSCLSESRIERIFVPKIELKRKYRGEWQKVEKPMYPGYIFLSIYVDDDRTGYDSSSVTGSDIIDRLFLELKKIPYLTKILGADGIAIPLTEEDKKRIKRFIGEGDTAELSVGIIEGDRVKIFEGSLVGQEAIIKKIDRHKRTAKVEVEFMGEKRLIEVGLEIITKNKTS